MWYIDADVPLYIKCICNDCIATYFLVFVLQGISQPGGIVKVPNQKKTCKLEKVIHSTIFCPVIYSNAREADVIQHSVMDHLTFKSNMQ